MTSVAVTPGVDLALLDDSRVWFSPSVVGLSVGVYLGVTLTSDLVGGDTITLTLPGFEGPENSDGSPVWLTLAGENWLDFNEENGCLWDQATQTLTLTADSDTFFPGM